MSAPPRTRRAAARAPQAPTDPAEALEPGEQDTKPPAKRTRGADGKPEPTDPEIINQFGQWIVDEHRRRKERRKHKEKIWVEVDRQVAMRPKDRVDASGRALSGTDWMPEVELPLQAESLEVLCTDARRLMFDQAEDWYRAHAAFDDDYIQRAREFLEVAGNPIRWNQDAADKVTQAGLNFFHRRYDFKSRVDLLNSEAFKYGTFAFRSLMLNEDRFQYDPGGVKTMRGTGPVLVPVSIKSLFIDDAPMHTAHEGLMVAPSFIRQYWQSLSDIRLAASIGSKGEENGWILDALEGLTASTQAGDHKDQVELLEFEGDLVHTEGSETIFAPNVIITVAVSSSQKVVRIRGFDFPFRSYTIGHYQRDDIDDPYGCGPLAKGYGLQIAATEALNRTLQASVLNTEPPIRYDPNDWRLSNAGGPRIEPRALWPSMTKPEPIMIGDPAKLYTVYGGLLKQYQDQTGVNDPRMGSQTVSHVTAFAVGAQQQRGVVRTVDYTQSMLGGPLTEWLYKAFEMAKKSLKREPQQVFIDQYKGFIKLSAELLPDIAVFDAIGPSNPQEEEAENQRFMQVASALVKIEPVMRQMGARHMDLDALRMRALERAGETDVESLFQAIEQPAAAPQPVAGPPSPVPVGPPVGPALPGTPESVTADSVARLAAAVANGTTGG